MGAAAALVLLAACGASARVGLARSAAPAPSLRHRTRVLATATAGGSAGSAAPAAAPPLSAFAARVDAATSALFGAEPTARVRRAWARLDAGEEHEAVLADHPLMLQRASSFIDGLSAKPWHEPATKHKWAKKLESGWKVVRDELRAALADEDALAAAGNNVWAGAKNQTSASAYGQDWRTLALCDRTVWDETNAGLFPRTCELLHKAKVPLVEAFFAKMPPHTVIGPHSDMCNFALTAHLGVLVPKDACHLTVGDGTRTWADGRAMLFDTSILHEARNDAPDTRYILMMRVYHPELTGVERKALQFIFDCLDEPELLDDAQALQEYPMRRAAVEAASRRAWERALQPRR